MKKKYKIIYADPPWSYKDTQQSGGTAFFGASVRYPTMNNLSIAELPIKDLTDKDCALFLWATSPLLPEALLTMEKWGFKFKTLAFCWNKKTKTGKWVSNMGRWTMGNVELCFLATKGKPQRVIKNVKQLVIAERTTHSRKPDEVRNRIVELMGDLPRIELFAREKTEGWDVFGNEVEGSIEL